MVQYVLACVLWAKPDLHKVEVNVDEYGMSFINHTLNEYTFEASVIEESINYIKITYNPVNASTQGNSQSYDKKSMTLRLNVADSQSSLDCEVKQ